MKQLLLSTLLAFSVNLVFAADVEKATPIPKCTANHVPIVLKTKDGKSFTAFVKKDHAKKMHGERGIEAMMTEYFGNS